MRHACKCVVACARLATSNLHSVDALRREVRSRAHAQRDPYVPQRSHRPPDPLDQTGLDWRPGSGTERFCTRSRGALPYEMLRAHDRKAQQMQLLRLSGSYQAIPQRSSNAVNDWVTQPDVQFAVMPPVTETVGCAVRALLPAPEHVHSTYRL